MHHLSAPQRDGGPLMARFAWWRAASPDARQALLAASLGWMLDSFDVMLWAMVLVALMSDLGLSKPTAGLLGSLTLAASAVGGLDLRPRRRPFRTAPGPDGQIPSIRSSRPPAVFATGSACWPSSASVLGLGMGGEWASGASLVSETWPAEHRGKALGIVQSSWAVGYAAAGGVSPLSSCPFGAGGAFSSSASSRPFSRSGSRGRSREPEIWRARQGPATEHPFGLRRDLRPQAASPDR